MADSNIGALPLAPNVADDSLMVMEQQGQAMKLTGQMLKSYAKQGVELEFQDYLDEAKTAAEKAAGAVSAVTDMTVEAHASDTATVTKSTRNGKVNLDFGLPRGEQGVPGPEGQTGPRGPQGAPGNGLTILGQYDTETDLKAAVTAPAVGDAYGVGPEPPYDIFVFDGVSENWKNYGPLSGGGGSILPENVVTSEGGASLEIPAAFGDAPHVIVFTDEEEPPLTAEDIVYGEETVQEAISKLFTSVSDGKTLLASAITDKGVPTQQDAAFAKMAENIAQIQTGGDTSDATATPGDILGGKTAYTASGKVEGIIPSLPAQTITPGTADKTLANGQYLAGTQIIKGDANLTSANIKKGVTLFGVAGALESSFAATLTVKADIGAVVTATCGDTSVEALSTTGTVVLELPFEGTWKVTAQRGMAQYNTATVVVSSQYSAELTAEVYIEYYKEGTPLSEARNQLVATTIGHYVLFAGGYYLATNPAYNYIYYSVVDAYDASLTHSTPTELSVARYQLAAAAIGNYALFAGGYCGSYCSDVDAYDASLTHSTPTELSAARYRLAAAVIGNYALFAGGYYNKGTSSTNVYCNAVDAYNANLVRSTPTALSAGRQNLAAATVGNYALFAGGYCGSYCSDVDAYNASLTHSTPTELSVARDRLAAATIGNYVLFAGGYSGSECVDAYDVNLTRSTPTALSAGRQNLAAATIGDYALFVGGAGNSTYYSTVDVYDATLTRTTQEKGLSLARSQLAGASLGIYALFAGGYNGSYCDTVDIFRHV